MNDETTSPVRIFLFASLLHLAASPARTASTESIFDARFTSDAEGFVYLDDAFLATHEPDYANGAWIGRSKGATGLLSVTLGNRDAVRVTGFSGGWSRAFVLDQPVQDLRILFRVQLIQASGFERDEFGQIMIALDGKPLAGADVDFVARIEGDGDGGSERATGWLILSASEPYARRGRHVLTIGGYANKKTAQDESIRILIDDVRVTAIFRAGRDDFDD